MAIGVFADGDGRVRIMRDSRKVVIMVSLLGFISTRLPEISVKFWLDQDNAVQELLHDSILVRLVLSLDLL